MWSGLSSHPVGPTTTPRRAHSTLEVRSKKFRFKGQSRGNWDRALEQMSKMMLNYCPSVLGIILELELPPASIVCNDIKLLAFQVQGS